MKKTILSITAAAAALAYLPAQAQPMTTAEGVLDNLSLIAVLDFESEYVFRGQKLASESFQPSVEAGLPIASGDAYAGIWSSQAIGGTPYNEINFYGGFALPLDEIFSLDVGGTYYYYPDKGSTPNREKEIYVGGAADVILNPALYVFYNFTLEQLLFEGSVGHSFMLTEFAAIDLGIYLGSANARDANSDQAPGKERNSFWYFGGTADLVYALNEVSAASIGVRYSNLQDGPTKENLWWGATLSFGF